MDAKSLTIKVVAGLTGAGGVSVLAYQGYNAFNSKEESTTMEPTLNKSKLESAGYTALPEDTTNNSTWETILTNYKKDTENLKFANFSGEEPTGGTPKAVDTLKSKCNEALNSSDNELLKKAKKWCITPVTVTTLLKKEGYTALNTKTGTDNADDATWRTKISEHKNAQDKKQKIIGLDLSAIDDQEATNLTKIKQQCATIGESKNYEPKYEEYQINYKDWCSNKQ